MHRVGRVGKRACGTAGHRHRVAASTRVKALIGRFFFFNGVSLQGKRTARCFHLDTGFGPVACLAFLTPRVFVRGTTTLLCMYEWSDGRRGRTRKARRAAQRQRALRKGGCSPTVPAHTAFVFVFGFCRQAPFNSRCKRHAAQYKYGCAITQAEAGSSRGTCGPCTCRFSSRHLPPSTASSSRTHLHGQHAVSTWSAHGWLARGRHTVSTTRSARRGQPHTPAPCTAKRTATSARR